MQLVFTQAATLNQDGSKVQVGHEPDGELVQYFLNSDRVRNSSYKVVLGDYSDVSFVAIPNRIPSRNYVRFGIKTFPKIGAYGWFRSKYENLTHILVPLRNIPIKYDPPTFSYTQTTTVNITITPPSTVAYECYRIIFRDAYYSYEVITYDTTVVIEKPRNGTYELYIIGYRSTGETSEETPRQTITIVNGAVNILDRVASIKVLGNEAITGNVTLKAGDNVTLSEDTANKEITIAATGGGGTSTPSYVNPIDEPPSNANAMDDEFSDTTLDSKWSWLNQNYASWTENGLYGYMTLPGSINGDNIRGLLQPAPTLPYTMICKIQGQMPCTNYFGLGLIMRDSISSRISVAGLQHKASEVYAWYGNWTNQNSWNSDPYQVVWPSTISYVKVDVTTSTITASISLDGEKWTEIYSGNLTAFLTNGISHIGLVGFRNNNGNYPTYAKFEWFRVIQP